MQAALSLLYYRGAVFTKKIVLFPKVRKILDELLISLIYKKTAENYDKYSEI